MRIRAFQGLRPDPSIVSELASLPYDVVNTEEARALAKDKPASFLHVVRAEIDLPAGTDLYDDAVYAKAKENLEKLQAEGHLQRETEPCLYLYQQKMGEHVQRGLTAVCHIEDYEQDIIKKHEKTRPAKENDRLKLNQTLDAHPGPVFLTYRDVDAINQKLDAIAATEPLYDFKAEDDVEHTVWRIPGGDDLVAAFADVPVAYVADGHHRSASAYRLGKEKAANNPNHTGEEDYNYFLSVLFPASNLQVLPYNRVVRDLNGLSPVDFIRRIGEVCTVYENNAPEPERVGQVSIYIRDRWIGLVRPESEADDDAVSKLDVAFLQDRILGPLLGIEDPRTSPRIEFVGGIRGTAELEKLVTSGDFAVAFSMYPVTVEQLMDIADAGAIMPPKSTWFEPKLRSGLFVHTV